MKSSVYTTVIVLLARSSTSFGFQASHQLKKTLSTHTSLAATQMADPATVSNRVFETDKRPIILFDGVCNLCNNAVNLALDWDPEGKLRFSALQSNVGRSLLQVNGRQADDISSIVVVTEAGAFIKSDAILVISEELSPVPLLPMKHLAKLGRYLVPQFLRDIIYDGVADNRYQLMGKRTECRFDADGEFEDRFVDDDLSLL
ncbi:unnamed protein product [Cylindrotheca closterium]|uniref:Thiol-disulfide oxidoreductase DCC n=1 Tax=Cylindrotheca closterium TaxID=2856 RepID=A0AAD2JK81_9STRA|nr:unnamed protein product [Cylindrotheca closterium]